VSRTLGDWPADVAELADTLGVSTFAIVGVSAGGPYAAACAALIPSRLTDVAMLNSRVAKFNWEERPGIQEGWSADDRAEFELMQRDVAAGVTLATANLVGVAREIVEQPELMNQDLAQAEGDSWFFEDPARVQAFDAYHRDTFAQGLDAAVWEFIKIYLPWGFRLADIPIPVRGLARKPGSVGRVRRRRVPGQRDSAIVARGLARQRASRIHQALGRDHEDGRRQFGHRLLTDRGR
jgi:pimeloyl-ACP methyl ester carboxylesterase